MRLFFVPGVTLPDPHGLLQGKGKATRHIVVDPLELLDSEPVVALVEATL